MFETYFIAVIFIFISNSLNWNEYMKNVNKVQVHDKIEFTQCGKEKNRKNSTSICLTWQLKDKENLERIHTKWQLQHTKLKLNSPKVAAETHG